RDGSDGTVYRATPGWTTSVGSVGSGMPRRRGLQAAADGDQREPEGQGQVGFRAEEGDGQVLEPELEAGNARPAEHDAVQVPAEHPQAVEELDVLDGEARPGEARPELRPLVAPVVVDGGVDRAVEAAVRGDEEDQPPAWRQALSEAAEGGPVVLDVLEDVQAQDGVEPVGGEGGGVEVGQIEGH